jgi:hypothetical protein
MPEQHLFEKWLRHSGGQHLAGSNEHEHLAKLALVLWVGTGSSARCSEAEYFETLRS